MLANPARELLRVFESWSQPSATARYARPLDTEEEIAQALHAALLLRDIQRLVKVAEVERPEHNLSWASKYYARWAQAIFQYPHGWEYSFQLESYELDMLSALAGTFDAFASSTEPGMLDWLNSQREALASKVREVAAYVADDKGLSSSFRAYIHEVMQSMQCLSAPQTPKRRRSTAVHGTGCRFPRTLGLLPGLLLVRRSASRFRADSELESASCKRRLYDGNCFLDRDMHRGAITVFCVEGEVLNDVVHFLDGFVGAEPRAGGPPGFGGVHWCFLSWWCG